MWTFIKQIYKGIKLDKIADQKQKRRKFNINFNLYINIRAYVKVKTTDYLQLIGLHAYGNMYTYIFKYRYLYLFKIIIMLNLPSNCRAVPCIFFASICFKDWRRSLSFPMYPIA